jgi:hypothetical protein
MFLCAASLFGTIIAQANEIFAELTTKKKELDHILEAYLTVHPKCVITCSDSCVLPNSLILP